MTIQCHAGDHNLCRVLFQDVLHTFVVMTNLLNPFKATIRIKAFSCKLSRTEVRIPSKINLTQISSSILAIQIWPQDNLS
jgi:hypothetical protein